MHPSNIQNMFMPNYDCHSKLVQLNKGDTKTFLILLNCIWTRWPNIHMNSIIDTFGFWKLALGLLCLNHNCAQGQWPAWMGPGLLFPKNWVGPILNHSHTIIFVLLTIDLINLYPQISHGIWGYSDSWYAGNKKFYVKVYLILADSW